MKKSLIIALCCITVLFTACKKEKPYEKFIGDYYGSAMLNGTLSISAAGMSLNRDIEQTFPMGITLSAGTADNILVMTYTPEGEDEIYTVNGTINEDQVTFEPVLVNENIEGVDVNLTLNLSGSIANNIFALTGNFSGNGNISLLEQPIPLPFTVTGTVSGNLNKTVTEQ